MIQIQLFILGEQVELFEDESVTLTQSLQDIRDISKVFTDYSRTFTVPASKKNNKIFKHFYNFNILGFDARTKKDSELFLNYKPFKKGRIKFEGVQLKNNEPTSYKITFFGNSVNLKDKLGDDKLSNLTNLNQMNFDYTDANIQAYLTTGKDVTFIGEQISKALVFPLITVSDRLVFDKSSSVVNTDTVKNVSSTLGLITSIGLPVSQLKPAIRLYTIIKAIEAQYDITFSDDFFKPSNLEFFNLYMWLHNKKGALFQDQDAQYPATGFSIINDPTPDIRGFKSASFENEFNANKNKRELKIFVAPTTSASYNVIIKKDGEEFQRWDNLAGTTLNGENGGKTEIEIPNGVFTFYVETITVNSFTIDVSIEHNPNNPLKGKSKITYRGSAAYAANQNVNITSLVPKMKTMDFLQGVFRLFNLTAFQNQNGVIEVMTLDQFYASSSKTWDITSHLDKTQTTTDSVLPFKEIEFKYQDSGSFLAKNHEDTNGKSWGSLNYADGKDFNGTKYTVELPFEHFKYEHLYQTTDSVFETNSDGEKLVSNVQYGYSVDDKQDPYLGKPLIFYANRTVSTISTLNLAGDTNTQLSPFMPMNNLLSLVVLNSPNQSINFNEEFNEFTGEPNPQSLFKKYYKSFVKDMMDERKRLTTVKAFLPIKMMHNLSLADKIIVFDDIYRINKINTNFETNQSTVELTNIFEEIKFNTITSIFSQFLTIDFSSIFTDNNVITIDGSGALDGFTIPDLTTDVPNTTPANNPTPMFVDTPLLVTPPKITQTNVASSTNTAVYFGHEITELGLNNTTPQLEEYGFLYSTSQSDLTASDDIATLKAKSGITDVTFKTTIVDKFSIPPVISYQLTGLTDPATIFYRFFARTKTSDLKGDAISDLLSSSTIASSSQVNTKAIQIGTLTTWNAGNLFTYMIGSDGVCDKDFSNSYTTNDMKLQIAHTGTGSYPVANDLIRVTFKAGVPQTTSFSGGAMSLTDLPVYTNYVILGITDDNNIGKYGIIVEWATAKVVESYLCP